MARNCANRTRPLEMLYSVLRQKDILNMRDLMIMILMSMSSTLIQMMNLLLYKMEESEDRMMTMTFMIMTCQHLKVLIYKIFLIWMNMRRMMEISQTKLNWI